MGVFELPRCVFTRDSLINRRDSRLSGGEDRKGGGRGERQDEIDLNVGRWVTERWVECFLKILANKIN